MTHARSAGGRVTTASAPCARAHEPWFGDLSAPARRLALPRTRGAYSCLLLLPRAYVEGTRPFLARSVESPSRPCPHASGPVPLLPYSISPALAIRRMRPAPRRRRSPSRTDTLRPGARGATRVARALAEPLCWEALSPGPPRRAPRGGEGKGSAHQGQRGRFRYRQAVLLWTLQARIYPFKKTHGLASQ